MSRRLEKTKPYWVADKKWGSEIWVKNGPEYCGKILNFKPKSCFSMHFHIKKTETWYILNGVFLLKGRDADTAEIYIIELNPGDVVDIERGLCHQLSTETGGQIMEVSTEHFDLDSYRVAAGDSQS